MRHLACSAILVLCLLSGGPAFALGGDFSLTADDGSRYALTDSRGKVVILSFGFTFCPDICPTALATIASALNTLGDEAARVEPLFVSLDPDRDTPAHLHEYTRFFHPALRGLTGDAAQLRRIADQYRVRYAFVGKGETERYTLDHSANLFVIDTQGKLLRIIPHGLPPRVLVDSVRMALTMDRNQSLGSVHPAPAQH